MAQRVERPYVVLSAAMSADGYIDDSSDRRLILSGPADLDQVDAIRAESDAILVGARTVRRDNPGLRVKSAARRAGRQRLGRPTSPVRVTVTRGGGLDPGARFFAADDGVDRLVYAPAGAAGGIEERLGPAATVVGGAEPLSLAWVLADLAGRGIGRLMVEGGAAVLGQFLAAGLADELRLAVAPVLVADASAPRLVAPGLVVPGPREVAPGETAPGEAGPEGAGPRETPHEAGPRETPQEAGPGVWPRELQLAEVGQAGRMAVLRYRLIAGEPVK